MLPFLQLFWSLTDIFIIVIKLIRLTESVINVLVSGVNFFDQ